MPALSLPKGSAVSLFRHFEVMADAPDGVRRMRELILQLAVRGKLVPQDPADEPASALLERIAAEKERLFAEGKIGRPKVLPPIGEDDVPYAAPEGWAWVQLGAIAEIEMGNSPPGNTYNSYGEGYPLINGPSEFSSDSLGETFLSQYTTAPTKLCDAGDLLICVRGATTGRTNIAGFTACIGRGVALIRAGDSQQYVNRLVVSRRRNILAQGSGSTFPSISYRHLAHLLTPLPPLPEQRRIVAKVDELMALCDQLEARQQRRTEARAQLNRSALHHLTTAEDGAEVATHWRRLEENFVLLYDTPETVAELRQAVLQLAVRGRLVPQDPADEPASALLQRIAAEKQRLFSEGEIGRPKPLPPVREDEVPFEVPEGWEWARLGNFGEFIGGGTPSKGDPSLWNGSIPWVTPKDMKRPRIGVTTESIAEVALLRSSVRMIPAGAILMVVRGMILVRAFPVAITTADVTVNQDMKALRPYQDETKDYLLLALNAVEPIVLKAVERSTHGTCRLDSSIIHNLSIPLPPLPEQRRIVAKVDELMALCDRLEARLTAAREKSAHLAASVVYHLAA